MKNLLPNFLLIILMISGIQTISAQNANSGNQVEIIPNGKVTDYDEFTRSGKLENTDNGKTYTFNQGALNNNSGNQGNGNGNNDVENEIHVNQDVYAVINKSKGKTKVRLVVPKAD